MAQLRQHEAEFRDKGATLAAIGLGDARYARIFREEAGIDFPLLVDAERKAYRAAGLHEANVLHIFRGENAKGRKRARSAGHGYGAVGKDPFQLGGSFVFGPGNVDRFAHVSETFSDNASPEALLAAIP